MYPYSLPHKISNIHGEELTFEAIEMEDGVRKMIVSGRVQPACGPAMHTHFKQDESLTVVKGKMGYQLEGQEPHFLEEGESVLFPRGQSHRFWSEGEDVLEVSGWIKPANTTDYFLSALYASMNKAGKPEGDPFDSAYLVTRYRSEYDVSVIPAFVKRVIMPITVFVGQLLGKYEHFKDAPEPLD